MSEDDSALLARQFLFIKIVIISEFTFCLERQCSNVFDLLASDDDDSALSQSFLRTSTWGLVTDVLVFNVQIWCAEKI